MVNRESIWRQAVIVGAFVSLVGSFPAVAQTQETKPPAEKPAADKSKPAPQPPRRERGAPRRDSAGEERPRPDVPVSFPVDI